MIDPVPDLLGAQLRRLCVEPGLDEHAADRVARQPDKVDAVAAAQRDGARRDGVDMAGNLHDARPYRGEGAKAQFSRSSLRGAEGDAAIQSGVRPHLDCFAPLAMTI